MFNFPTLQDQIRTADNRMKFNRETGGFNTDWLGAEQRVAQMGQLPEQGQEQAPPDPGQQRMDASMIDPVTGQRVWRPGAGPSTGLPGGQPGIRINPLGNREDALKKRLEGYAGGGEIEGAGGGTDDMVPALVDGQEPIAVSNGELIVTEVAKRYWGKKRYQEMEEEAQAAEMQEAQGRDTSAVPGFARGGEVGNNGMAQAMAMIQMMMGLDQQQKEQQMQQEQQPLQMEFLRERILGERQQRQPDKGRQAYYQSQQNSNDAQTLMQLIPMAKFDPRIAQFLQQRYGIATPTPQQELENRYSDDPASMNIRQQAAQKLQQTYGGQ